MPKVIFLVGLCGSGKTRKARQMVKEEGFVWIEGYEGEPARYQVLVDSLRAGRDCVAEEFQTLTTAYRKHIEERLRRDVPELPDLEVIFWFFEKDMGKAAQNILSRPDDKKRVADHLQINHHVFHLYEIPSDPKTVILSIKPPTPYEDERILSMPTIEISQEHYDRLMAFKPVIEQVIGETMSDSEYADFIAFTAVERLLLEAAMSGDLQFVHRLRDGDTAAQAALSTLHDAQLTLQALSRCHPQEVFQFLAAVWQHMNVDERRDKGYGFGALWKEYKKRKQH